MTRYSYVFFVGQFYLGQNHFFLDFSRLSSNAPTGSTWKFGQKRDKMVMNRMGIHGRGMGSKNVNKNSKKLFSEKKVQKKRRKKGKTQNQKNAKK